MKSALLLALVLAAASVHADPGEAAPARAQRWAQEPVVVPPPIIEVPARAPAAVAVPVVPVLPPPVEIGRPIFPAACDAGGCWTNDGTRLNRTAPACTLQANVLVCR